MFTPCFSAHSSPRSDTNEIKDETSCLNICSFYCDSTSRRRFSLELLLKLELYLYVSTLMQGILKYDAQNSFFQSCTARQAKRSPNRKVAFVLLVAQCLHRYWWINCLQCELLNICSVLSPMSVGEGQLSSAIAYSEHCSILFVDPPPTLVCIVIVSIRICNTNNTI